MKTWRGWFGVLAIGAMPLLWFRDGLIATGGDHVFPLEPIGFFLNRLSTWDARLGAGTPKGIYPATLVWHGLQAAASWAGLSPLNAQRVTYVLWFTALAGAMYGLVRAWQRIRSERPSVGAALVAASFYTLNPVMFNIWEAGKAGEISAALGLPLLLLITSLTFHGLCPFWVGVSAIGLTAVVVSEWGSPPVLGAVLLCFGSYVTASWLHAALRRDMPRLRRQVLFVAAAAGAAVISSCYWWMPLLAEVFGLVRVAEGGAGAMTRIEALRIGSVGFSNWLEGISLHTSLLNVMRLQGIWDWYYSWGELPYVSYAKHFFGNPLFLLLSVALPIGAYLAVMLRRDFHTFWCAGTAILFTVLACGTHWPTGLFYKWLSVHVPGFTVFRSPFYKFGLVLTLLYACLLATTVAELARRWRGIRWISGTVLLGVACYGFPMFTGAIIPYREGASLSSIKLKIPRYVYEAADWLAREAKPGRIILLPEQAADSYRWGFSSQLPLLNYLVDRSILHLIPQGYPIYLQRGNQVLLHLFTHAVSQGSVTRAAAIARRLGVRYILVCRDSTTDVAGRQDAGAWIEARLKLQEGITLRRVFGEWAFYEVAEKPVPLIYAVTQAQILTGEIEGMVPLAAMDELPNAPAFLTAKEMPPLTLDQFPISRIVWYNTQVGDTILENVPELVEQEFQPNEEYTITIPRADDYLVGVFRPPEEPYWVPPKVLIGDRVLTVPASMQWLPPSERWVLYGSHHFSPGSHRLRILEYAGLHPRCMLMIVPLVQVERSTMAWLAQLGRPNRALMWLYSSAAMRQEASAGGIPGVRVAAPSALRDVTNPWGQDEWVLTGGATSRLIVENDHAAPQWADVALSIRALGMAKDLTLTVTSPGREAMIHPIPKIGAEGQAITLGPLWLSPGRTVVELYTPFTQTAYPVFLKQQYGRGTFQFRDFRVGRPVMHKTFFLPRMDAYRLAIHRFHLPQTPEEPDAVPYRVLLDQRELPLMMATKRRFEHPRPLTLPQGWHTITVIPSSADHPFGLQLATDTPLASGIAPQPFRQVSATDYRISSFAEQPHLLVFREAFDPNWMLTPFSDAPHVTVDGYANGWWIQAPRVRPKELRIQYRIQQIFLQAAPLSALTVAACLTILGFHGMRMLRRRRAARRPR